MFVSLRSLGLRSLLVLATIFGLGLTDSSPASAQPKPSNGSESVRELHQQTSRSRSARRNRNQPADETPRPRDFRSKNFVLHTDLPEDDARELLERLETMLTLISQYWGRPNRQTIEMYVVDDLSNWQIENLDPQGVESIRANAGVTVSTTIRRGRQFVAKSIVYAVADRGTPQHEAVHAYCAQTFGTTGPVWYSEGMAEMGQYWRKDDSSVNCHPGALAYLRNSEPKSLNAIINGEQLSGDSWQDYAWRWALCHLLTNNTNYAARFRPLGLGLLTEQNVSFEQVYGSMANEIVFEYLFFLEHMETGYRVDLCSWDWKTKFVQPTRSRRLVSKINAQRGWQASRAQLVEGKEYEFSATGTWKVSDDEDAEPVDADGDEEGRGRLVGVIFNDDDYSLGEPLELGTSGTFEAPASGHLFLRCQTPWNEIAGNSGEITVQIKAATPGSRLPNSKQLAGSSDQDDDASLSDSPEK